MSDLQKKQLLDERAELEIENAVCAQSLSYASFDVNNAMIVCCEPARPLM